jgi:hypothetical protein
MAEMLAMEMSGIVLNEATAGLGIMRSWLDIRPGGGDWPRVQIYRRTGTYRGRGLLPGGQVSS